LKLYIISGERIRSELPLDAFVASTSAFGEPGGDLTLRLHAPTPPVALREQDVVNAHEIGSRPFLTIVRDPAGYRIRAHGYADFVVDADRRQVRCLPIPGAAEESLSQLFVDRVLPNVVSRGASPVLHASSIALDGRAVLFLGDPGQGKSTLASALAPPAEWLGDDAAALRLVDDGVLVYPSAPFARLFQDSLSGVGACAEERVSPRNDKWRLRRPSGARPRPLVAAFRLGNDGPLRVERLTFRDALTELARHLYRLDPSDVTALREELVILERMAGAVPVFELQYPRRYDAIGRVREAISEILAPS